MRQSFLALLTPEGGRGGRGGVRGLVGGLGGWGWVGGGAANIWVTNFASVR